MDTELAGQVVVVTGATANIGRAIALAFASKGARVVAVGRDREAGERVTAEAQARGAQRAVFVEEDLLDPAAAIRIAEAAAELGSIAVLVNNVGGNVGTGLFVESDPNTWLGDLDLNLLTILRMTHAILPDMIERQAGRIINIDSTAGLVGDYLLPLYSTAKAAVHGFTRTLAKEVGQHGITVNCVAPYGTMAANPAAFSRGSRFHPQSDFFQKLGKSSPEDRGENEAPGRRAPERPGATGRHRRRRVVPCCQQHQFCHRPDTAGGGRDPALIERELR
ncbi:MAG: SDR family oxidoreductase [Halieaceae bacterium]|nr:SDR family oxidoreductase [Halieaceae bacterium]